jgi:glycosyltransferase involved in cell wall biosynthesis
MTITSSKPMTNELRLSDETRRNFAVIVPAVNEVENIPELISELRTTFEKHNLHGEVILVDDGSKDGTADVARELGHGWKALKVVSHRRNFGKTEALITGAEHTDRDYLILFDADLQHSPEEIPRYLAKLEEGFDIVTGRKIGHYEKRGVSSTYNWLNQRLFDVPVSDLNSMKGFRRAILDEVHLRHDWHRFFVVLAYDRGFSVTEIDITLYPRRHGTPKYSGRSRILTGLLDLVSVGFFLFFSKKPMVLFGMTGLAMAAGGLVVGVITTIMRVLHVVSPIGYRPLLSLVVLLETLGFLLFGFGFIAELVAQQQAELDALNRRIKRTIDR